MTRTRTKIVCTIGPSCSAPDILRRMADAGMTVARLNFSHGTHADHAAVIGRVRALEKELGRPIAIMQDLQGPKIRVGLLPQGGVALVAGAMATCDTAILEYRDGVIPIDAGDLHRFVKTGERLLFDDGRVDARIVGVEGTQIRVEIVTGGQITSHKGVNVPETHLPVRSLTDKDRDDLAFGLAHDTDMIALSFVQKADDIREARELIANASGRVRARGRAPVTIVAKIERREAVDRLDEILDAADAVMVARGDLGIELPTADVPIIQKTIIARARARAKPVIVATQMLDSMQSSPRPTRAEASDVANAVIDHADALMLSNETASGQYPAETVETMHAIIEETEISHYDDLPPPAPEGVPGESTDDIFSGLSRVLSDRTAAACILAASLTGESARMVSRYRPHPPIYVATTDARAARQMALLWGVRPFLLPRCDSIESLVRTSFAALKKAGEVKSGDKVIVVAGEPVGTAGHVNFLEVREVE